MDNLYLVGFMGSGKSTVGRRLADRLGRRFVDLDEEIEKAAGRSVARIFSEEGEPAFRRIEADLLGRVSRLPRQVVATGGGVVESAANRATMASTGRAVWLYCGLAEAIERALAQGASRPLLAGGPGEAAERARAIWARREWLYARSPVWADTRGAGPDEAADRVLANLAWAGLVPAATWVLAGRQSYPVSLGCDLLVPERAAAILSHLRAVAGLGGSAWIIADRAVAETAGRQVQEAAALAGFSTVMSVVGPGEAAKRLDVVARLYEDAMDGGVDRHGLVLGVGGGAALDTAGFAAATYMRGIPWVSVPTTLLAQLDAAIGGKTAVNLPRAKNMVGAFHPPCLVLADAGALKTLPRPERSAGLAEAVKHALVGDTALLDELEREAAPLLDARAGAQPIPDGAVALIRAAASVKAAVVSEDPQERGRRIILNFGHTVAHALEAQGGYRAVRHGEAVAIGMVSALRLSLALGLLENAAETMGRVEAVLRRLQLPTRARPPVPDAGGLWGRIRSDKKTAAHRLRWVLLRRPGVTEVVEEAVSRELFEEVWRGQHVPEGGEDHGETRPDD